MPKYTVAKKSVSKKKALNVGDIVRVRQGRYVVRARVIEAYEAPTGLRVTVRVPADPMPGDDTTTYSYSVADVEAVPA